MTFIDIDNLTEEMTVHALDKTRFLAFCKTPSLDYFDMDIDSLLKDIPIERQWIDTKLFQAFAPRDQRLFVTESHMSYKFDGAPSSELVRPCHLKLLDYVNNLMHVNGWMPSNKSYTSILVNYYQNGKDHIGFHCDKSVDPEVPVVSMTYYTNLDKLPRIFAVRPDKSRVAGEVKVSVPHETMMVMGGHDFHRHYYHALLKEEKKNCDGCPDCIGLKKNSHLPSHYSHRISFTMRRLIHDDKPIISAKKRVHDDDQVETDHKKKKNVVE